MTNTKSTKRALLSSVLALVVCIAMLVGSTFAWFTDNASTAVNTIQAGNLKVELLDKNDQSLEGKSLKWVKAAGAESEPVLWEPGCTYALEEFYVKNDGNLALKYELAINGIVGNAKLLEAIEWTVTVNGTTTALEDLKGELKAGDKHGPIVLKGHMKEEAGNEYQGLTVDGISITVFATQLASEYDSINNTYDQAATFLNKDTDGNWLIQNKGDLLYFANAVNTSPTNYAFKGETIKLTADIDLGGMEWTPIGKQFNKYEFGGRFDGQGHTISNFTVNSKAGAALFGFVRYSGSNDSTRPWIKNLNVKDVTATGGDYVAAIVGQLYGTIEKCNVENVTAIATPFLLADGVTYDGGAKVGGVVGWMESGAIYQANKLSAKNVTIKAYRDLGGVIGMAHNNNTATNLSVDGAKLGYVHLPANAVYSGGSVNSNRNEVIGRKGSGVIDSGNTFANVTFEGDVWYTASTADLQNAFDTANSNTTIYLADGVDYGTVYMGRPTKNNDTVMTCDTHGYTTTNAEEFKAHLNDGAWHTTPKYNTTLKNLTVIGAEGATVAGLVATSGHAYGDVYDYVRDKDYAVGSAYYNTLNIENVLFSKVNFTGKIDINTSDANTIYNGVTFDKCTFTTGGIASANGAAIRYYNESNNGNVKNIVVTNCTFNNCYQGVYVQNVNGVTVTGCTFDTTGHNAIAIQSTSAPVNLKNVVITNNTFKNIKDRVVRFGAIGADSNITIQNNKATNSGDEDGEVMRAVSIEAGITTDISNNTWNGIVVNPELQG